MDTPRSLDVTPAPTLFDRLSSAVGQIDGASLLALLAIFIGSFFIDTLAVTLGSLQHGVRFIDVPAAIADPTRIFFGVDGSFQRIVFGFFCLICLSAPADATSLGGSVIRFANDLVHRSTGLVSRHVSVGIGGYLAFAGALVLAAQGMRHLRRHAP